MSLLAWRQHWLRNGLALAVLAGTVLGSQPPLSRATSLTNPDMNVTISVYTCCGSLQGFNDTNPKDVFSIHNIYTSIWSKKYPGLKFAETLVNNPDQLETKLTLAVNAGNPPDMVFIQRGYLGFSVLRKLAQPLDQYFSAYHVKPGYILPSMMQWVTFGGHIWAIPSVSGPLAGQLLYIPKYMTPLGYNNSNLRTFDDLYNMSKKAVQFDKSGNLTRIGYWPGLQAQAGNYWESMETLFCSVGHGLYNAADQPTATDPCNVAALTYLKKLSDLYGGYAKLTKFLSGDPDFWTGSPKDYMATGQALIPPDADSYWDVSAWDSFDFGVKGGIQYNLTPLPVSLHGTLADAQNFPAGEQVIIIPPGAKHPDQAFAISKLISWDYGYLLGPSTNGSPVTGDQQKWLDAMFAGEAASRKATGLAGNPSASLPGLKNQPMLAIQSKTHLPINPVNIYYQTQLLQASARVLYGQQTPQAALAQVQQEVLAEQSRLQSQYGKWNW
jgi:multiple sugar transport system substrate-binding protein